MRAVVWAAVVVVLTGCAASESEPEQAEAGTPAPLAAPSIPGPSPEEEAVGAYLGMMGAVVEASLEGAEDHPDLERHARGRALELTTAMLDGAKATGEPVLRPEATDVDLEGDPASIVVEDCMDNTEWVLEGHAPRNASERNTRLYRATVVQVEEHWQVEDLWAGEPNAC